jgi:hypothetical protein
LTYILGILSKVKPLLLYCYKRRDLTRPKKSSTSTLATLFFFILCECYEYYFFYLPGERQKKSLELSEAAKNDNYIILSEQMLGALK